MVFFIHRAHQKEMFIAYLKKIPEPARELEGLQTFVSCPLHEWEIYMGVVDLVIC